MPGNPIAPAVKAYVVATTDKIQTDGIGHRKPAISGRGDPRVVVGMDHHRRHSDCG